MKMYNLPFEKIKLIISIKSYSILKMGLKRGTSSRAGEARVALAASDNEQSIVC